MKKTVPKILLQILFIYIVILTFLYVAQRSFIYFPSDVKPNVTQFNNIEEIQVTTSDSLTLTGWFKKPKKDKEIIVFFHGNASNHLGSYYTLKPYLEKGYGFLSVGYRGYSGNEGKPSEQGFYNDARAFINILIAKGTAQENIILYGQSIGSGVAVQMATEFPNVKAVILESPYTSLPDVAAQTYFFVPVHLLMKDQFDSLSKIKKVIAPLFILQGTLDKIIPPELGKILFSMANEPKEIISLDGYAHNDLPVSLMAEKVMDFLE